MNTKTCKKCGWVYPITHPDKSCRFCKEPFEKRFCSYCGKYAPMANWSTSLCKECFSKYVKEISIPGLRYEVRKNEEAKSLAQWLALIEQVPKPIKTLTENEWLDACSYFKKCAYCSNEAITARSFFIAFKLGGRYAAWNIVPVCDKCALQNKRQQNPWVKYNPVTINSVAPTAEKYCLKNITAYLHAKLMEAINSGNK